MRRIMQLLFILLLLSITVVSSTSCTTTTNAAVTGTINYPTAKPAEDEVFTRVMNTIENSEKITDTQNRNISGLGKMRLGAYFWYGFSYTGDHYTDRLFQEFADREPVWGWVNESVENMEQQIEYASAAGLSYFAFDWYYNAMPTMNRAVDTFLKAKNCSKMDFCLMVCNHEGAYIPKENWEDAVEQWMPYLTSDRALKVDGKPVIMFFSSYWLNNKLGGNAATAECIDYLRQKLVDKGYPGVVVIGSECPYGTAATREIDFNESNFNEAIWTKVLKDRTEQGLTGLTGYNYRRYSPLRLADGTTTYAATYEELYTEHETCWKAFSDHDYPYVPVLLGGWDCRPWETYWKGNKTGYRSCYAADRTPAQLYNHILDAAQWLKDNPECSIGNLAVIYAWNETCEGGYIAPTKGDDGRLLAAVHQAMEKING